VSPAASATGWQAHPTATIDPGAEIGAGTRIWHYSHVMAGARIGERCILGQNVFVGPGARLGNGCKVQNNVSLYDAVELEDHVFCGPSMVFTNVVNPRAAIEKKDQFRVTRVGHDATLGANCTVVCGVTIGHHAMVGAGAVVTHDVPPHALMLGVPARQTGWVCACGETLALDYDTGTCTGCGSRYRLSGPDGGLEPLAGAAPGHR
jgi:UDP-2-acetamido-3-amino-2,3-dideoxy-glucuronate N-acetyltransferase